MSDGKCFYKYRRMDEFTQKILTHGEIYFAKITDFNDPFELFFKFSDGDYCTLSEEEKKVLDFKIKDSLYYLSPEESTKRFILSMRNNPQGIFCLSKRKDNIHMYAHYADSFKGICIGFNSELFSSFREMNYLSKPYLVKGGKAATIDWINIVSKKSKVFKEEKEVRIVDSHAGVLKDGCQFLIFPEASELNYPKIEDLSPDFISGYIYYEKAEPCKSSLFYFDRKIDKKPRTLNFDFIRNDLRLYEEFKSIISDKARAPIIASLSNRNLEFLNQCCLTTSAERFPPQPLSFDPQELRRNIKEIIFGFNISEENVKFVLSSISDIQPELYVVKPTIGEYKLEFEKFNSYEENIKPFKEIYGLS